LFIWPETDADVPRGAGEAALAHNGAQRDQIVDRPARQPLKAVQK
jgi:hypothetical protein